MVHQNNWWQLYSKLIQTIIIAFEYMIKKKEKRYMFWFTCKTLKWVFVAGKALINLSTMLLMHFFTGLLGWSVH